MTESSSYEDKFDILENGEILGKIIRVQREYEPTKEKNFVRDSTLNTFKGSSFVYVLFL